MARPFFLRAAQRGLGGLGGKHDYQASRCPLAVAIADLKGDGKRDLVTANWTDPDFPSGTVSVFDNKGNGTFHTKRDYATGSGSASIAVADLNGDRAPDVVTGSGSSLGCFDCGLWASRRHGLRAHQPGRRYLWGPAGLPRRPG